MARATRLGVWAASAVLALAALVGPSGGAAATEAASSQTDGSFAKTQLAARASALEALYPNGLRFDVVRKGDVVGSHRTRFRRDGSDLVAESRMDLAITLLGFTVFRYDYRSTGTWRDGVPVALTAETNEDGDVRAVQARWTGDTLTVHGSKGRLTADRPLFPTNHWNPAVLTEDRVLNSITGGLNAVTITPGPIERVRTGTGPREARRFDYTGDLRVSAWYDARGRWVKLRFEGRDGTPVEYVCRECGGDQAARAR
ncbi:DUF6134 family protein [Roseospira goensis]|uniref:Uncharacterized protein n=1 Tax=Roseospira goensis TaxID=391922 RepID=A0A7W6RXC9_9PROT|nr:DUF6134 family protein [Roseospira goensis]MBB4284334.1 hypothetical protein [Roseospira goensis]